MFFPNGMNISINATSRGGLLENTKIPQGPWYSFFNFRPRWPSFLARFGQYDNSVDVYTPLYFNADPIAESHRGSSLFPNVCCVEGKCDTHFWPNPMATIDPCLMAQIIFYQKWIRNLLWIHSCTFEAAHEVQIRCCLTDWIVIFSECVICYSLNSLLLFKHGGSWIYVVTQSESW